MNDCCSREDVSRQQSRTHCCPVNGKSYNRVKRKTLIHHLTQPWLNDVTEQNYYFCTDPSCDVVYFGEDDTTVKTSQLRTTVWQKTKDNNAAICYCFGVTKALALLDKSIKPFITEQTKKSLCSCETSNPSGRCCLKDFPE